MDLSPKYQSQSLQICRLKNMPKKLEQKEIINKGIKNPLWFSVSEAAKIGGVNTKTIRRAIQSNTIKYKVVKNRYLIDLISVINYLNATTKLRNKLDDLGIGQYVDKWKE